MTARNQTARIGLPEVGAAELEISPGTWDRLGPGTEFCRPPHHSLVFLIEFFSHSSDPPLVSNSVTLSERHLSAARMSAPNISFRTALSPNAFGMILRRRRSQDQTLKQIRRADRRAMGDRESHVTRAIN
jgi:hypothetical protein